MSRTRRRMQKHLIRAECGTLDQARQPSRWHINPRYWNLPPDEAYFQTVARFTRDCKTYLYGVPRQYVNQNYTRPRRRYDDREIHRCIRAGCWDDHLPDRYRRGAHHSYW